MLVMITIPGCAACRRMKNWFREHEAACCEKNLFRILLNDADTDHLLELEKSGILPSLVSDLAYQKLTNLEKRRYLQNNPGAIAKPLLYSDGIYEEASEGKLNEDCGGMMASARISCLESCALSVTCMNSGENEVI